MQADSYHTPESIAKALGGEQAKRSGHQWLTLCPVHGDSSPSLSITNKKGHLEAFCHPCGHQGLRALYAELHRRFPGAFTSETPSTWKPKDQFTKEKVLEGFAREGLQPTEPDEYTDEYGTPLYAEVRCIRPDGIKTFRQMRLNGDVWKKGLPDTVRKVLFRLPRAKQAITDGSTVFIVEGPKDVKTLEQYGFIATTNVQGGGKWKDAYSEQLRGAAKIIAIPDNDKTGYDHVAMVGKSFAKHGMSLLILELPNCEEKWDITDWLNAGHTVDEFNALLDTAVPWTRDFKNPHRPDEAEALPGGKDSNVRKLRDGQGLNLDFFKPFSDTGNGERFRKMHGHDVRFVATSQTRGTWYIWDGKRFAPDMRGRARELAKGVAELIALEEHPHQRDWELFLRKSLNVAGYNNMLEAASSLPGIAAEPGDFDKDPLLVNCGNGVIDLRTSELKPHSRTFGMTQIAGCNYNETLNIAPWFKFLESITRGDREMMNYLQMLAGYWLSGDTTIQEVYVIYGPGQNGKSIFIDTLVYVLGEYAKTVRREMFMKGQQESQQDNLSQIVGKRLIAVGEVDAGDRLDEAKIKTIAGGSDLIPGRRLFEEGFAFQNTGKLVFRCNHLPRIVNQDKAIWRRIVCIPFDVIIPDAEVNPYLMDQLKPCWPGILAWAVTGYQLWAECKGRPQKPQKVLAATAKYKTEMDVLGWFLEECSNWSDEDRDTTKHTTAKDMQAAFQQFCREHSLSPWRGDTLGRALRDRGVELYRSNGMRFYKGIQLRLEYRKDSGSEPYQGTIFGEMDE